MRISRINNSILCCPVCGNGLDPHELGRQEYICQCGSVYCPQDGIPVMIPLNLDEEWVTKAKKDKTTLDIFFTERLQKHNEWWIPYNEYREILMHYDFQVWRRPVVDYIVANHPDLTCILDAGGGHGWFLDKLLEKYPNAQGHNVDLSSVVVANGLKCHKNKRIYGYAGSITHLPFVDESFDVILAIEVIEHLRDISGFIKSAYKKLKKGGSICVTTPNPESFVMWFEVYGFERLKNIIRPFLGKQKIQLHKYGYLDDDKEGYEVFKSAREIASIMEKTGFTNVETHFNGVIGSLPFYFFENKKIDIRIARLFAYLAIPIDRIISKINCLFLGKDTFICAQKEKYNSENSLKRNTAS